MINLIAAMVVLGTPPAGEAVRWPEERLLAGPCQLTFPDRFVRAGEAYFSHDDRRVIFQAVARPTPDAEAEPFYSMYVAELTRDASGVPTGLSAITRVSPAGSANTCGWFHPTDTSRVLFGSTVVRPADEQKSGFQVGTRTYRWMFPQEMEIVEVRAFEGGGVRAGPLEAVPVFMKPNYDAECSYSNDGRFVLYAHVEDRPEGLAPDAPHRPDANIYVYDTVRATHQALVVAPGYDGGPFFSPDGRSICYRSDRRGNDKLQLFVADLKLEKLEDGALAPVGIAREYQVTDNDHVNWAPYWHPTGGFLVYGSSEVGHHNYELFAVEVGAAMRAHAAPSPTGPEASVPGTTVCRGLRTERLTHAEGADVLPAFNRDGTLMMWTSQRAGIVKGEERPSSQLWIASWRGELFASDKP